MKTGAQIAPKNVVVLPVVYGGTGLGNIGAEAQLVGNGTVQVFTNGHVITGTWTRPDKATPMKLVDADRQADRAHPGPDLGRAPRRELPDHVVGVTPPLRRHSAEHRRRDRASIGSGIRPSGR